MVRRSIRGSIPVSDEAARDSAVEDVLREQEARSVRVGRWPDGPTPVRLVAALLLVALTGYVWAAGPRWFGPESLPRLDQARETAGQRLSLAVHFQRVLAFRDRTGRLPDQLRETGEVGPGVGYRRFDARTFELRAAGREATLSLEYAVGEPLPQVLRPVPGEVADDGRLLAEGRTREAPQT